MGGHRLGRGCQKAHFNSSEVPAVSHEGGAVIAAIVLCSLIQLPVGYRGTQRYHLHYYGSV